MRIHVGDWMGVRVGEHHSRKDDPKHIARVEAIHNSSWVKLRWFGTPPLTEFVSLHELQTDFERVRR